MQLRSWPIFVALFVCISSAFAEDGAVYEGKIVQAIDFRGNRRAETDAIRIATALRTGDRLVMETLRDDIRSIWTLGYFEDVQVQIEEGDGDKIRLVYVLKEKPTIRKIFVSGNQEVGLDKINEVLDLKKGAIWDAAKVRRNEEKVRELYVEKGYYLSEVRSEVRRVEGDVVDIYFFVNENAKVEIRHVRFLGNHELKDSELKKIIATKEGGFLSFLNSSGTYREEALEQDQLILTAYYYDHGFINAKVGKPTVTLSADRKYIYVAIPIEEGPIFSIGKVDFQGDLILSKDEYARKMTVRAGDRFNRSKLGVDIQKLNDGFKDLGYAYVNIQPLTAVDAKKRTVDLTFDIQKGSLVYFGRIHIRGNTKTRDKVIRRELRVYEGELYNQTRLDRSKQLVQALGFFDKVELSTKSRTDDSSRIDVSIEVSERSTGTFQIGAGFSSVENFIGQAQVAQNNLFGRGTTLQLQAQISSLRQLFSIRYLDPYFLDTRLTFSFSAYNSLLFYPSFNRTARGGDLTWGYLFGDYVRVFGTYKLENVQVKQNQAGLVLGGFAPITQVSSGTVSNLFRSGWTSSIRLSMNYDTRDDRLFPKKGMFHSLSVEFADPLIASEQVFTRFSGFTRFYRPIWGPIIFRTNLEAGFVFSRSSQGVPIYERYLLGGINTIRGYTLFSLGPRVGILQSQDPSSPLSNFNIGGNLQLVWNNEIEFPIVESVRIKGVVFLDIGNSYNTELARYCPSPQLAATIPEVFSPCTPYPTPTNLRYSVGFGVRWFSPIGPLRFEWGIPLNRQFREDPIVFEFTIGNFF